MHWAHQEKLIKCELTKCDKRKEDTHRVSLFYHLFCQFYSWNMRKFIFKSLIYIAESPSKKAYFSTTRTTTMARNHRHRIPCVLHSGRLIMLLTADF